MYFKAFEILKNLKSTKNTINVFSIYHEPSNYDTLNIRVYFET
jgi:hypothetical protein